jgi:hypothetical protein
VADASLILERIASVSWLDWGRRLLPGLTREVEKQLRQMQGRTRSDSDDERRRLRQEEKLDLFIAGAITQSAYENNSDQSDVEMGDAEDDQLAVEEPELAVTVSRAAEGGKGKGKAMETEASRDAKDPAVVPRNGVLVKSYHLEISKCLLSLRLRRRLGASDVPPTSKPPSTATSSRAPIAARSARRTRKSVLFR